MLNKLLEARRCKPFAWGTHDCATLAFDAKWVITGIDPAADIRGSWSTANQAIRLITRLGGWDGIAKRFGHQVLPEDTFSGDIVLLSYDICVGPSSSHGSLALKYGTSCIAQGTLGLVEVSLNKAIKAWRML